MQENVFYHLVLEARPGDFMPIDINILLNNPRNINYHKLNVIDEFTKKYTKKEIYDMIEKNNIVPNEYLNGQLHVINDSKYRFMPITKEIDFSIDDFFKKYIDDKQIMNKFLNIYIKYCKETKDNMANAIKNKNQNLILNILFRNSYESVRSIYVYIYQNIILNSK